MLESPVIAVALDRLFDEATGGLKAPHLLAAATLFYLAYHLAIAPSLVARLFPRHASGDALRTAVSFFRKGAGVVFLGLLPAIPAALLLPDGLAGCGLTLHSAGRSTLYALAFIALTLPLVVLQARKPAFREHYPEVRSVFTPRIAAWNALGWAAYLLAYELFFRGFLVLGLAHYLDPLTALAVSLMGYVFVHLGKYPGELIGTLFTGTIFGLVALDTGSILMPFLAHLGVALASDTLAARPLAKVRHA